MAIYEDNTLSRDTIRNIILKRILNLWSSKSSENINKTKSKQVL